MDPSVTSERIIWLQFDAQSDNDMSAAVWLTAETLAHAWARRRTREQIVLEELKTDLRTKASFLSSSQYHANVGTLLLSIL